MFFYFPFNFQIGVLNSTSAEFEARKKGAFVKSKPYKKSGHFNPTYKKKSDHTLKLIYSPLI